jgi:hypothetical protein
MIVSVLSLFKSHHGHAIRIVDHDPLEVEIVGLEVLGLVDHSTLQGRELIIDWDLVAFNHPFSVVGMLTLFSIVYEVLVINSVFLDYKICDWWLRSLIEIVDEIDHQRPIIFLFFKHLENEFLQLGTVAGMDRLGVFILDWFEEWVYGILVEWRL